MKPPMPVILRGDARALPLPDASVDLVVTSPPYFGLRSYTDGGEHYASQVGAEPTPAEFISALIECTREMARVLKPSGSIFVNLGDKYSTYESRPGKAATHEWARKSQQAARYTRNAPGAYGVPYKSLMGLPWRYAIRCVDELGLIHRNELIWSKERVAPTRITDRTRRTHEHFFHFTKRASYYANLDEVTEPGQDLPASVMTLPPVSFRAPAHLGAAHHAVFPTAWPRWIIRGWCPPDGTVLDPFSGTGTTALVAAFLGRRGIGVDLSADYCRLAEWRASDPKERARAAGFDPDEVAKLRPQLPGQFDLFGEEAS